MPEKDFMHWTKEDFQDDARRTEESRLSYWFPKMQQLGILMPKTVIVKSDCDLRPLPYGEEVEGFDKFLAKLTEACQQMGLPFFLRTDLTSAKHDWIESCYVTRLKDLPQHVYTLCEHSAMANIATDGWPVDIWVIREFMPLMSLFLAFKEMPITRERRYFIRDGEIVCHHPYWPVEAFEKQENLPDNWKVLLRQMNHETEEEQKYLTDQTKLAGSVLSGYWSCDWAFTQSEKWMLIDMARGEDSYHWPNCLVEHP